MVVLYLAEDKYMLKKKNCWHTVTCLECLMCDSPFPKRQLCCHPHNIRTPSLPESVRLSTCLSSRKGSISAPLHHVHGKEKEQDRLGFVNGKVLFVTSSSYRFPCVCSKEYKPAGWVPLCLSAKPQMAPRHQLCLLIKSHVVGISAQCADWQSYTVTLGPGWVL